MTDDKPVEWHAMSVTVEPAAAEAIEFAFNELDALGTEINLLGKRDASTVTVIGYFHERLPDEKTQPAIGAALSIYGFGDVVQGTEWRRIGDTDWLYDWKKHWKPTVIGSFIVSPTWEEVDEGEKHVIWIEPNMAFGTGTHETTQLCLRAIERNFQSGQSLLDVGTGTGILAIGAAKLHDDTGAMLACDTDPGSIDIARENAELNGVADRIKFYVGSISEETPQFDFVCANLTIDVTVPILPLLLSRTRSTLLLSGILKIQEPEIVAELHKNDAVDFAIEDAGEWISVVVTV